MLIDDQQSEEFVLEESLKLALLGARAEHEGGVVVGFLRDPCPPHLAVPLCEPC